jgi:uncharacterized protein YkwD
MVRRILLLSIAAGALALPAASASADSCPGADATVTPLNLSASRDAILCLVNVERTGHGLNALTQNDRLERSAQGHTDDMLLRDFFEHVDPSGDDPGDRITAAGYSWWAYGENIAAGYRTPREVMLGWMQSTGHCHNILDPGFTELGVGVNALAATIARGVGTWTQNFGRPSGTPVPGSDRGPQQGCPYSVLAEQAEAGASADSHAPSAPAGETPTSPSPDANGETPADGSTPGDAAPAVPLGVARYGGALRVEGTASGSGRVRVTLSWHGHTIFRTAVHVRGGHSRLHLRGLPRSGRITVRLRGAGLRVTRSVS